MAGIGVFPATYSGMGRVRPGRPRDYAGEMLRPTGSSSRGAIRRVLWAAGLLLMAGAPSKAGVVFTTFVSGTAYPCCNGQSISGASATIGGSPLGAANIAAAFTAGESSNLAQIDVAIWGLGSAFGDPDTTVFDLSLHADGGGVPGPALGTWAGLNAPGPFALPIETVFPTSAIPLTGGQKYWIVASAPDATTFVVWNLNAPSGGPGGSLAVDHGAGWLPFDLSDFTVAFDVLGTSAAPEPGAWGVCCVGLAGLAAERRRRSRKAMAARRR